MSENIPHSLGGFRGAFESEHGRKPTEQEIWNAAISSWRDLTRQKSDAVKERVVESLLEYAGDNGYSHIDYADTMRHAAALLQSTALPVGELTDEQLRNVVAPFFQNGQAEDDFKLSIPVYRAILLAVRSQSLRVDLEWGGHPALAQCTRADFLIANIKESVECDDFDGAAATLEMLRDCIKKLANGWCTALDDLDKAAARP